MIRIRSDYVFGSTSAALTTTDTVLTSSALARLPAVAAPDVATVTLHDTATGLYEIVHVTAHTAAATTATILRAQEGSTARAWASGTTWLHGPTAKDLIEKPSWETSQRTVYVATTGSDTTGDGTSGNPWATIQHAVNQARSIMQPTSGSSGYKVLISPGTYVETVIISSSTLASLDVGLGGGIHLQSSTSVKTDVIIRATGLYAIAALGTFTARYLTLEADTYAAYVTGGRHVTGYLRDCTVRRTSLSDGAANTRAIEAAMHAGVLSTNVTSEAGRLFGYGLAASGGSAIAKSGTQPSGAVANELAATGGVIR